jgi:hypothetical protein
MHERRTTKARPGSRNGPRSVTIVVYLGGQRSQYFAHDGHSVHDRTSGSVSHA